MARSSGPSIIAAPSSLSQEDEGHKWPQKQKHIVGEQWRFHNGRHQSESRERMDGGWGRAHKGRRTRRKNKMVAEKSRVKSKSRGANCLTLTLGRDEESEGGAFAFVGWAPDHMIVGISYIPTFALPSRQLPLPPALSCCPLPLPSRSSPREPTVFALLDNPLHLPPAPSQTYLAAVSTAVGLPYPSLSYCSVDRSGTQLGTTAGRPTLLPLVTSSDRQSNQC